jgi:hypothetical protein
VKEGRGASPAEHWVTNIRMQWNGYAPNKTSGKAHRIGAAMDNGCELLVIVVGAVCGLPACSSAASFRWPGGQLVDSHWSIRS